MLSLHPLFESDINLRHSRPAIIDNDNDNDRSICQKWRNPCINAVETSQLENDDIDQSGFALVPKFDNDLSASWVPPRILSLMSPGSLPDALHEPWPSTIDEPLALEDMQCGFAALVTTRQAPNLTSLEYECLRRKGAFTLPPRLVCEEMIDAYFTSIAPLLPIINRAHFMRRFLSEESPPSYLLMQSVLLAACRVCRHPFICEADGSTTRASRSFYQRAKALYDANYEANQLTIVQALTLLGWYWDGPEGMLLVSTFLCQVRLRLVPKISWIIRFIGHKWRLQWLRGWECTGGERRAAKSRIRLSCRTLLMCAPAVLRIAAFLGLISACGSVYGGHCFAASVP